MVTLALVGVGAWGKNLLRALSTLPGARLKWVYDKNTDLLARAAASVPQARAASDLEEILADPETRAVAIATPARTHHDIAKACLEAGKDVFVEKPLSLSVADGSDLVRAAKATGRRLMVGHLMRYHPAFERLLEIAAADAGRIHYVYSQRLNLGVIRRDENALWSLAPHDVSMILALLGGAMPARIAARGGCFVQPGVEDVVFATMTFPGGELANLHVSWLDPHKVRRLTVVGAKKMITFDDQEPSEKIRIYEKGAEPPQAVATFAEAISVRVGDVLIPRVGASEPLRSEMAHFVECVEKGAEPRTDAAEGLRVLKVLSAAQASIARGGEPVEIA